MIGADGRTAVADTTAAPFSADATVPRNGTATFTVRVTSDGSDPVDLRLASHGGDVPFSTTVFSGSTNITAAVRNGTYAINDLAVGARRDLRVVIRALGSAGRGARTSFTLRATSQEGARYRDLVRANVLRS